MKAILLEHLERLEKHRARLDGETIASRFQSDPKRFENFSLCLDPLVFDYSKNGIDKEAFAALLEFASAIDVETRRDEMVTGETINRSENRAALHMALRATVSGNDQIGSAAERAKVAGVLEQLETFAQKIRDGGHRLSGGKVTDVVNIGIGGSDLGPAMAATALDEFADGPRTHFISNVDAADIAPVIAGLDPKTTLLVVASKSFTTRETMINAATARAWLAKAVGEDALSPHLVALSTNLEATRAFGVADEQCFKFWDWVGGRFSVWSAIGLSLMIAIGPERFKEFLQGAGTADRHFMETSLATNIPVIMALIGFWHRNVCNHPALAVVPYDQRLKRFPAWLQQLDMESNGKSVDRDGNPVTWDTAPIVFGEPGTNAQHAFFQLLHQGTQIVPCDFLVAAGSGDEPPGHRTALLANCLAQSEALMNGRLPEKSEDQAAHRIFAGNRPSNIFMIERLDAYSLGLLMALYEHKIAVQGFLWGVNSFDQWGVELGKTLAGDIEQAMAGKGDARQFSSSTQGLLRAWKNFRDQ